MDAALFFTIVASLATPISAFAAYLIIRSGRSVITFQPSQWHGLFLEDGSLKITGPMDVAPTNSSFVLKEVSAVLCYGPHIRLNGVLTGTRLAIAMEGAQRVQLTFQFSGLGEISRPPFVCLNVKAGCFDGGKRKESIPIAGLEPPTTRPLAPTTPG